MAIVKPIIKNIQNNNFNAIRRYAQRNFDFNNFRSSIVYTCIDYSRKEIFKYLIENGLNVIDPNCSNCGDDSVFYDICVKMDEDFLTWIFENNYAPINNDTFYHIAYGNHVNLARYFINNYDIEFQNSTFINICSYGFTDMVKLFIENGIDIHNPNEEALMSAVMNDRIEVVQILLENGADIHFDDDNALKISHIEEYEEMKNFLIENGADISAIERIEAYSDIEEYSDDDDNN